MTNGGEHRKRLKLSNPREVRKALNRIANMVINKELDNKSANTLVYVCNAILGSFNKIDELEGDIPNMKSNRQFTIQQLLRAAEITGDGDRREQYLDAADKLIREELSPKALTAAKKSGIFVEQ